MKKLILFLTLILTFAALAQTSEFRRYFTKTNGSPLSGYTNYIYLVPQTNDYPVGALTLNEDGTRPGIYYRANVPDGEYKIYIDVDRDGPGTPTLYLQHYWVGENRLSIIADNFDATDSYTLKGTGIKDGAVTESKIGTGAVTESKIGSGAVTNIKLGTNSVTTDKISPNAVESTDIKDANVTLPKLSQTVLDYINASGGGTITNLPDDVSLESKPGSTIGVKDSYIQSFPFSGLSPKQNDTVDKKINTNSILLNVQNKTASWIAIDPDSVSYTSDSAPYINRIIQTAVSGGIKRIYFPAKDIRIDSPIMLMNRLGNLDYSFVSIDLIGSKLSYGSIGETRIFPNYNDKPAILIVKGKGCLIANLSIQGKNTLNLSAHDTYYGNQWITNGSRDTRYSPYGAIVIDPFRSGVPSDGGYPGLSSYYTLTGTGGSTQILMENLTINHFVVGILISPNGQTANAENITMQHLWLTSNKIAISICQSQSRTVYVKDIAVWGSCKIVIDCTSYGQMNGPAPMVDGMNLAGAIKYIFNCGGWGQFNARNIYAESVYSIGTIGNDYINNSFTDCYFNLNTNDTYGFEASVVLRALNTVTFYNCYIGKYSNTAKSLTFVGNVRFENCTLDAPPVFGSGYSYYYAYPYKNCTFKYSSNPYYGLNTGVIIPASDEYLSMFKKPASELSTIVVSYKDFNKVEYKMEPMQKAYSIQAVLSVDSVAKRINLTANDTGRVLPGDIITGMVFDQEGHTGITGVIGTVESVNGYNIVLKYPSDGILSNPSLTNYGIQRQYLMIAPTSGNITAGSNIITNVSYTSNLSLNMMINSYGLDYPCYITKISNDSVWVSRKALISETSANLYDALYQITFKSFRPNKMGTIPTAAGFKGNLASVMYPSEAGTAGNKYAVKEYIRITNGTGNVVGTDWVPLRSLTGN